MLKKIAGGVLGAGMLVAMAGPASAATNNEQITIVARTTGDTTTSCQAVATGPITGVGTCTTTDLGPNTTLVHVMLPNGTVDIKARQVSSSDQFSPTACVDRFTFREKFTVTGGTGAYAGATGHGTDVGNGVASIPRNSQGCDFSQPDTAVIVVTATGHVSLAGPTAA
jgi:hypothetical protein